MPAITLPDGSVRHFAGPVTGTTVAADIGPGLARAALAMRVDGKLLDLSRTIEHDAAVTFVTRKDPEALELIRHDAAHVLAEAVQALYPGTQVTIGPAIENGFYYDFARNEPFTPEDLPAIEAKMREIVAANAPFTREVWDRDDGHRLLRGARRALQGRADPGPAGHRDDHPLPPGRLDRPLPRPAHARHRRCRHRLQADEGGRRLLARRPPQRHAAAASTAPPGATRRNSTPICSCSRRPSSATTAASARAMDLFHMQEGSAGLGLLAPEGLAPLPHARKLHAPPPGRRRLPGGQDAAAGRPRAVGSLRPLGKIPPEHVRRDGRRGAGHHPGAEADELPLPCADLQPGPALLPRTAAAHGGVRLLPSLRALGRAARHHARARLHAGRRAYLLHRGPDRVGDGALRRRCSPRSTAISASTSSA